MTSESRLNYFKIQNRRRFCNGYRFNSGSKRAFVDCREFVRGNVVEINNFLENYKNASGILFEP